MTAFFPTLAEHARQMGGRVFDLPARYLDRIVAELNSLPELPTELALARARVNAHLTAKGGEQA